MAGGLASTLLLKFGVQNFNIAILCSLISFGVTLFSHREKQGRHFRTAVTILIALFLFLFSKASSLDRWMTTWNHPYLVEVKDSPYSRVTITALAGQISVFENDALAFDSESTAAEEFVHLAILQHHDPNQALILGGGIEGIIEKMLEHSLQTVDYVELNRTLVDMAYQHLPPEINESLNAESVRIIFADPRKFLKRNNTYDVILVGMPEPTSGQTNRFYTREFFEQCSARLNPGGILAFSLRSAENLWTPQLTRRIVSIHRALASVFSEVLVLPGVTNIVIASHTPLTYDPTILSERFDTRRIAARLISPAYIHYLYTNDRFFEVTEMLTRGKAPVNTDARPICYQYAIMIWLSKFFPALALFDFASLGIDKIKPLCWFVMPAVIAMILLLSRRWSPFRRILLVGMAGFLGMVIETLLILHYQVYSGILFQDIGILLMTFMAGLSLGSLIVNKLANPTMGLYRISRWVGLGLLCCCSLLVLIFVHQLGSEFLTGILGTSFLLIMTGFIVAGVFAYVSLHQVDDQRVVISPLYAADLIGGCVGSVMASLALIPMIGLENSAYLMAVLAVLSMLLL